MKAKIDDNGNLEVSTADEGRENPDKSPAIDRWSTSRLDQSEKIVAGISDPAHTFSRLPRGDKSALRDMANEARKQRES